MILGLPKHIKDEDVHCEYPVDADDEYVTERGFQPTLPGESTKLSSALAFFKAARILSKVLEEVFPAKASYDLSLKKLSELSDELDAWQNSLAPHLRLQFAQDKPSTGTISSRSPLISLTYHYIRCLIHRPAICASIGTKASSSMLALASSCKSMVQIIQLLEERALRFSFCVNRDELLVLSGFGLLFQRLKLDPSSKILKDNQKMILAITDILFKSSAPCAAEFRRVANSFLSKENVQPVAAAPKSLSPVSHRKTPSLSRHNSEGSGDPAHLQSLQASTKKQLKAIAARFTTGSSSKPAPLASPVDRRATVHNISLHPYAAQTQSQPALSPLQNYSPRSVARSEPTLSPHTTNTRRPSISTRPSVQPPPHPQIKPKKRPNPNRLANLDYLSFGTETEQRRPAPVVAPVKTEPQPTDWEKLLGSLDNGQTNIFDACYGGQPIEGLLDGNAPHGARQPSDATTASVPLDWDSDLWALCQTATNASTNSGASNTNGHAGSIWSFSTDEGKASAEDLSATDWGSSNGSQNGTANVNDPYKAIMLPDLDPAGDFGFPGVNWETFGA